MKNSWEVSFRRGGLPGKEMPIEKSFQWGGRTVLALSAYLCEEGIVSKRSQYDFLSL